MATARIEHQEPKPIGWMTVGLGLLGVGVGLAQLFAPRRLHRLIGAGDRRGLGLTRALGLRKIAIGLALFRRRRPAGWLWARAAGDILDLALLLTAARNRRARLGRIASALGVVLGATVADLRAAVRAKGVRPRPGLLQ